MTARHSPLQQYREACQIARDHGCLVLHRGDSYLLYRKMPHRNVYLGCRKSPEGLRRFVCQATGFK